ncbi:MAG: PAS domain S-box protein [Treponema sp.]|nr:PAS domain S-box protein [Treponema sp.]
MSHIKKIFELFAAQGRIGRGLAERRRTGVAPRATKRRIAEDRLKRTEMLLRSSIEGSADMLVVSIDKDYRCLYLNRSYHDRKAGDLGIDLRPGDNLLRTLSTDAYLQSSIGYYQTAFSGEPVRVVEHYETGDSYFETLYNPLRDDRGAVIGATAFTTDVTKVHRTERLLRTSEARLAAIVSASPDGIVVLSMEGRVEFASSRCAELFGFESVEEELGRNYLEFLDPEEQDKARAALDLIARGGALDSRAFLARRRDGSSFFVEINAEILRGDGGDRAGLLLVLRDVTERKNREDKLRELAQNRATLMKELQHRVKNTLTLVSSLIAVAKGGFSDERAVDVFTDTETRIGALAAIYERLYLSEDFETIDFGRYIEELAPSIFAAFTLDSGRIRLDIRAAKVVLETKRAISLGLILNELLTNCLKHAFPSEAEGRVSVSLEEKDGTACLVVADDGVGLPDAAAFRSSGSMGLTLIRMLVEQIGGSLRVETAGGVSVSVCFDARSSRA